MAGLLSRCDVNATNSRMRCLRMELNHYVSAWRSQGSLYIRLTRRAAETEWTSSLSATLTKTIITTALIWAQQLHDFELIADGAKNRTTKSLRPFAITKSHADWAATDHWPITRKRPDFRSVSPRPIFPWSHNISLVNRPCSKSLANNAQTRNLLPVAVTLYEE